jgi:Flp pilus assembly protein TadB
VDGKHFAAYTAIVVGILAVSWLVPELIIVLALAAIIFGPRTLWRMRRPQSEKVN